MNNIELLKNKDNRKELLNFIKEDLLKLKSFIVYVLKLSIKIFIAIVLAEGVLLLLFSGFSHIVFSENQKNNSETAILIAFIITMALIVASVLIFIRFKEHFKRLKSTLNHKK
ncbi:MAG: hypothetical protein ACYCT7_06880 [bacterium]